LSISNAVLDGPVTIERDAAQVKRGRRAEQYVEDEKEMTDESAKQPLALGYVVDDVKGHHKQGHKTVGNGQAHDEYVLHTLQGPVREHRQDDEYVAENAHQKDDHINGTYRKQVNKLKKILNFEF
jgi:hypothetical protein